MPFVRNGVGAYGEGYDSAVYYSLLTDGALYDDPGSRALRNQPG
jgi:hypothetical protein